MSKFRTVVAVILMLLAAAVGFFAGAAMNNCFGGAILFALIAGLACVVYTIDNPRC